MTAGGGPSAGHDGERIWPQTFVLDGHQLRRLRQQRGLSQEKLADQAGISMTTVVRLERKPTGAAAAALSVGWPELLASTRPPSRVTSVPDDEAQVLNSSVAGGDPAAPDEARRPR